MLVIQSANVTCAWYFHQSKFPESANKFKKMQ
ncbi:cyclic lactone autoinducer peptide [Lachnospiraceae bacterium ZAX-1]